MNLFDALRTGKPLRRPIPKHTGSTGGWLSSAFVETYLTMGYQHSDFAGTTWVDSTDLMATDWEVRKSAGDRLMDRIHFLIQSTGKTPTVLDVPAAEFAEIRTELMENKHYTTISNKNQGICGMFLDKLEVYTSRGPTLLVKREESK